MADNSRIEDLRKRYHENPRRFFAPLANEYRKSGLLDRALLLCQKHVPEQPENMNGLVVFGQTLFELGQHDAAREPFESALRLDPENLIALRHLGDIARLLGDVPTAKGWYEKVLELDRRNDEVLDLLAQLGAADEAPESPSARTSASGLISVAPSVSVSGAEDIGMIDVGDAPATPPISTPKTPAGKGGTVVIDAQALADRDRREAEGGAVTQPVPAMRAPAAETPVAEMPAAAPVSEAAPVAEAPPAPRPSKRASLLDIDFDFSEMPEAEETKPVPQAPVLGAEAAEYGFAAMDLVDRAADALIVETTGDVAPLGLEPTVADAGPSLIEPSADDASALGLEPTIAEPMSAPAPEAPAADLELAEFSAEVSPLAGLEASEFTSEQVAPMAELEPDSVSMSLPSVAPLEGLDRPDATADDVAPLEGLADLPLLEEPSAAPPVADADADTDAEAPSARPRPRMTKADLASLPLLADFGLDDEPVAEPVAEQASAPAAPRASKATPAFVTETMAALYVQQGLLAEAIDVYRQLLVASPTDEGLKAKLAELERMHAQEQIPDAPAAPVAEEMPEFDAPTDSAEPEPAPANAAMADVSFGEIALKGQGTATPIVTPAVSAGPSAREFFGGFARRAAVVTAIAASVATEQVVAQAASEPAAPAQAASVPDIDADTEPPTVASVSASPWPLDDLFGAASDVRDLHAAETLAGVGTFEGPDGGTGLGDLAIESSAPKRQVPRASETLKFDQFFQKPGTAAPSAPASETAEPGDDDLDQFQDWLKGLKP